MSEKITCEECVELYNINSDKISDYVFRHGLCAVYVNPDWSEDIIEAIKLLKVHGITHQEYSQARLSCNKEGN